MAAAVNAEAPMSPEDILERISRGRTDLIFDYLRLPDWRARPDVPEALGWLAYHGDVTALKAVLEAGGTLAGLDLDRSLNGAAFHGHWKLADFLIAQGADPNWRDPETGESPLHSALCKAGRPYYIQVARLLLERGAEVNARTTPGRPTGAFMRDVRTKGETPLHRAAAFADAETIRLLLEHGADREARDANDDSPLSWASWHLRPGEILTLLAHGPYKLGPGHLKITSDHGAGWGGGMEWAFVGDYLPESGKR